MAATPAWDDTPRDAAAPTAADDLDEARGWLSQARRVVVLTGAGISTSSGIPDFRGPQGVWTTNPGAEKAATLQHYMTDPDIRRTAWRRRIDLLATPPRPNPGHDALVRLEQLGKLDTLVTQNIDSLHHQAGHDPELIVEVHGHMREVTCLSCWGRTPMGEALDRVRAGEDDPDCHRCGGILKSATISFGQNLISGDLERADSAARQADLLLAVGSTLSVFPIADMVPTAKAAGALVVIVNGSETDMDHMADAVLRGDITTILPKLLELPAN